MAWLVLEDDLGRTAAFQRAAKLCRPCEDIRIWRIAAHMIRELPEHLSAATLLSLDIETRWLALARRLAANAG